MSIRITSRVLKGPAFFIIILLSAISDGFTADIKGESRVTAVTVYPGSARVAREAAVELPAGTHRVIFESIVPQLDENSITVSGKGAIPLKIFGAYIKREYFKDAADPRVGELEKLIERYSDQIQTQTAAMEVLRKEKEYLDSVRLFSGQQISKDLVTVMPTVQSLEDVRKFLTDRYADVDRRDQELKAKVRDLTREKAAAQQRLNELKGQAGQQKRQIVVEVESGKSGQFTLEVSYLVYGANWRPIYDARSHLDEGDVSLTGFGVIKQTTGEDWDGVTLTLSTAQPTVSGRMPVIDPWILQFQPPAPNRAKAMMYQEKASNAAGVGGQYEPYMLAADYNAAPASVSAEMAYSQAVLKGISVTYKIIQPATIKSDGTENKYPIATQVLKANFEYSSYPRLKPSAYLGSRVTNDKDLQLLAGEVNLFLDEDYIGKSSIDNVGPGEEFSLYLGVDENVKVKREQVSRKVDDVLMAGIKSPNRTTVFVYKLTVENYKHQKINVHLFEAVPVSSNEQIRVKTFDVSRKPADVNWKDRAGIWRWEFSLDPKAKQEIYYSFSVEHPREMNIPGI